MISSHVRDGPGGSATRTPKHQEPGRIQATGLLVLRQIAVQDGSPARLQDAGGAVGPDLLLAVCGYLSCARS